ncbi:RAMP superfamily CRISPR-associated protein [Sporolactobacillus sp. Y61]|uniref:RAMP superfamily CRISPR-associated protein n=1 Tax=Sporolactobacillus sp. Y61 TaxID=3160863 RepID=A0AAU8IIM2_9BACL
MNWIIHIELKSEAIFGNGQSVPGEVDQDIVHDIYGFPFYGAKALKGHLREQTEFAAKALSQGVKDKKKTNLMEQTVNRIFGQPGLLEKSGGAVKITDATVPMTIRAPFIQAVENGEIRREEIFNALTSIRSFTSIDPRTGTAEDHSLRKFRIIRKGLCLEAELTGLDSFEEHELGLLAAGIAGVRTIGMMKTRGKGYVDCSIREGELDVTQRYLDRLREWVNLK